MSTPQQKRTATRLIKKALNDDAAKGSKKDAALAVYAATDGVRSAGVPRLISDLLMTPGQASTYWQKIRGGVWN